MTSKIIPDAGNFFLKDRAFYMYLFAMLPAVALQNLIAYSINMADNLMLGAYSQNALSAAATVNQIFFLVQNIGTGIATGLSVLTSQYWGGDKSEEIRSLTSIGINLSLCMGIIVTAISIFFPQQLICIFTNDTSIISEGCQYLVILKWTYIPFLLSSVLAAVLRSIETVKISLYSSIMSLALDAGINYVLIFGKCGATELGIRGAAIGTLTARICEMAVLFFYLLKCDSKIGFKIRNLVNFDRSMVKKYLRVGVPVIISTFVWALSVPVQTAILGHISSDAIAANSIATTFYQYAKVIVSAVTTVSAIMIGKLIGENRFSELKPAVRSLSCIFISFGLILGALIFFIRRPLLSVYALTDSAKVLADHLMVIMGVIMVGMAYQTPLTFGVLQGGGDTRFTMALNIGATWLVSMPLSFAAAFLWKMPAELVVIFIQADQIWKALPSYLRYRGMKWVKPVTDNLPDNFYKN